MPVAEALEDLEAPEVLEVETVERAALLAALRRTRLCGLGQPEVYARASLELVPAVDPETLAPAQRYCLRPTVDAVLALRSALLRRDGIDVLALDGAVRVRTSAQPDELVPVLPPIVEASRQPDGREALVIADGMHRVQAARRLGRAIAVVLVRDVPPELPYYAFALPGGWGDVADLDALPPGFVKKAYRIPGDDRSLYRCYDDVFPGVQRERARTKP